MIAQALALALASLSVGAQPSKAKVLKTDARGCTWIESEALVTAAEDQTRHQVRASAVDEARRLAMQDFLGVSIRSRFMDFQQEGLRDEQSLTESLLLTTRQGRILDESVVEEGYRDLPDCPACRYAVKVKTCIVAEKDSSDKEFEVDLAVSRTRMVAGDEVTLSVTATRDCYVYIYDLWLDWKRASLLVPNSMVPEVRLRAGQTWTYPDPKAKRAGVRALVAELPEGQAVSAETIRVIASKNPLPEKTTDPSDGFLAVLRRLHAARFDWAEDAAAFVIYGKAD